MDSEQEPVTEVRKRRTILERGRTILPTALVLGALAAVGVWGHHTGWKAPSFDEVLGRQDSGEQEDWCEAHNVPDSKCIACHPELVGADAADWCGEHGVAESRCTVCHPEILTTGVAGDWCKEHGVPESGCTLCHPEIARQNEASIATREVEVTRGSGSTADGSAEARGGARDSRTCQKHALKVQFASAASMEKVGVVLGQVVERPMVDSVVANGEVDYDRTRFVKVASRTAGVAALVAGSLGKTVNAGDVLALIDSAELGRVKAEFLEAQAAVDVTSRGLERVAQSAEAGFRTESERLEAEAAARQAKARLFNARQALENFGLVLGQESIEPEALGRLGIPENVFTNGSMPTSVSLLPVRSPIAGTIVGLDLVSGEAVESGRTLFEVADLSHMWIDMALPLADAGQVALEQAVVFRPDGSPDDAVSGVVSWIATAVDETTRTLSVRAAVANDDGALRAHTFGRAQIVVRESPTAIAVPTEAVQWEGCCNVVFVYLGNEIFETRKVRLGARDAAYSEVVVGVLPGEVIATEGSHVLKSEILKSALGAGCVDD